MSGIVCVSAAYEIRETAKGSYVMRQCGSLLHEAIISKSINLERHSGNNSEVKILPLHSATCNLLIVTSASNG